MPLSRAPSWLRGPDVVFLRGCKINPTATTPCPPRLATKGTISFGQRALGLAVAPDEVLPKANRALEPAADKTHWAPSRSSR